jgi:hypothetical protein
VGIVRRCGRLLLAAVAGGLVGGVVGGLAARLAMWVVRILNPSHDGEITHAASEVGRWTLAGTLEVVLQGLTAGATGGAAYLLVRRLLPGKTLVRGVLFGLLALAVVGEVVLEVDYEYVRYVDPWISVGLFAAIFPVAGLAVALVVDGIAPPPAGPPRRPWPIRIGRLLLLALAIVDGRRLALELLAGYRH